MVVVETNEFMQININKVLIKMWLVVTINVSKMLPTRIILLDHIGYFFKLLYQYL